MIDSIKIKGFQSHTKSTLELHQGVNVIVGSSDTGKSSIVRALKWVFQNRPQGDSFKNNQLKAKQKTHVLVKLKDEKPISRIKSSTENYYLHNNRKFKALRNDVPDSISQISKMKKVNLQSQHPNEQYFLLTDSPGQVAKKFNKVAGFEIMDKALFRINAKIRESDQKIKIYDDEVKDKKQELKNLKWVIDAEKKIKTLVTKSEKIKTKEKQKSKIKGLLVNTHRTKEELKEYLNLDAALKDIIKINNRGRQIGGIKKKTETAKTLIYRLKKTGQEIKKYKEVRAAQKDIITIINERVISNKKHALLYTLYENINLLKTIEKEIKNSQEEITTYQAKFDKYLKENKCPVCGRI